jgi:hypothetical protein
MVVLDAIDQGYPFQRGKTMDDLLYFYVPRAFWPDKPESYALAFGREFLGATSEAGATFFTPTLPGELYLNFGIEGLLVGGLLTGLFLWEFYRLLVILPNRGIEHLMLYAVIMPFVALLLSGPISTIIEYILLRCACFGLFYWAAQFVPRPRTKKWVSRARLAPEYPRQGAVRASTASLAKSLADNR